MNRGGQLLLALLLLAACAGLGWSLFGEWQAPAGDAGASASSPSPENGDTAPVQAAADLTLALPPPEKFTIIAARPLFSPTRRPAPPAPPEPPPEAEMAPPPEADVGAAPEPAPEAAPPPAIDFTLVGIVIDGSDRYALVERHADAKVVRLAEGGDIDGWFAVLIDPTRAVFRQGGTEEELVLKYDAAVPQDRMPILPTPAPPAAQPAAPSSQPQSAEPPPAEPQQ